MATRYSPRAKRLHDEHLARVAAATATPAHAPAYQPTGSTAMARQHPLLIRTEEDVAHMTKAQERQARRAAKRAALAGEIKPTGSAGPEFAGADQRRLEKRARKALS